jgi:hypothetical protein
MTDAVPARGSLRSRGAALVSALTLRQISAALVADAAPCHRHPGRRRQLLPRLSPEATKAMAHVARFIGASLKADVESTTGKAG